MTFTDVVQSNLQSAEEWILTAEQNPLSQTAEPSSVSCYILSKMDEYRYVFISFDGKKKKMRTEPCLAVSKYCKSEEER